MVRAWFGANLLGAVFVPVNTAYRGNLLEHVIGVVEPKIAIVHADLIGRLHGIQLSTLETIVVIGPQANIPHGLRGCGPEVLHGAPLSSGELPDVHPWDVQSIVFTSGTTGFRRGFCRAIRILLKCRSVVAR